MRALIISVAALLLSACAGTPRPAETARFDLGPAAVAWQPQGLPIHRVAVFAPSWLGTSTMHYRLLDADPQRRHGYAESRWAAPPAELIERALERQPAPGAGGCRLRVDLDELIQVFDAPQSSRVQLDARASLLGPGRDRVLPPKALSVVRSAPTPDARGGAAAAAAAVQALAGELGAWLTQAAQEDSTLAKRCRAP